MIYTIEKANMVAEQLRRFTTGYTHHFVGQFANLDFWLDEVIVAQQTLDQYKRRFDNMRDAQKQWVEDHGIVVHDYCPHCGGKCEFSEEGGGRPSPPIRTSSADIFETRKQLMNAAYYFLLRCYRIGLLNKEELKQKCNLIGTSIELSDLKE